MSIGMIVLIIVVLALAGSRGVTLEQMLSELRGRQKP